MKKSLSLLSLFVGTLLFLSACQTPQPSAVTTDLNPSSDQVPAKSIDCNDLKTDEYRIECKERLNIVAGQILADEVLKTFDLKRCDVLPYDKVESCKTQLQSTGIQGPISLEDSQALVLAIAPVLPSVTPEAWQTMTEAERDQLQPQYQLSTCQNLSAGNGLKAYCEKQIQEKIEFAQLKEILLSGAILDCTLFKTEPVLKECERIKGKWFGSPTKKPLTGYGGFDRIPLLVFNFSSRIRIE